jgi:hypothetical protein
MHTNVNPRTGGIHASRPEEDAFLHENRMMIREKKIYDPLRWVFQNVLAFQHSVEVETILVP